MRSTIKPQLEVAFYGEALDALYKAVEFDSAERARLNKLAAAEGVETEGDFNPPCHEGLLL